jgi:hypothetical protein
MTIILGIGLLAASIVIFFYSLPRAGKLARFVNTPWEPYVVVLMIVMLGLGGILTVSGAMDWWR